MRSVLNSNVHSTIVLRDRYVLFAYANEIFQAHELEVGSSPLLPGDVLEAVVKDHENIGKDRQVFFNSLFQYLRELFLIKENKI